jgi:hypothetical protein
MSRLALSRAISSSRDRGQVLPRHFLSCGPFDHLQAEGMTDQPELFDHGGEKINKTIPIPVILKDPAPKVARQDLAPSRFNCIMAPEFRRVNINQHFLFHIRPNLF